MKSSSGLGSGSRGILHSSHMPDASVSARRSHLFVVLSTPIPRSRMIASPSPFAGRAVWALTPAISGTSSAASCSKCPKTTSSFHLAQSSAPSRCALMAAMTLSTRELPVLPVPPSPFHVSSVISSLVICSWEAPAGDSQTECP